ncbi:unnamed protein product [Candida verbasci]|uniref:CID domain-containing protein n=1 Tax=Candida verbasci TaxID=1227364 RepID=A0A9W4XHJ2_9ASCO|nr:unnamed protein product [Candida verbasci]
MDSFDIANQFAQLLRNLTPQIGVLNKAATFALKNSDNEDYLFPTILNVLHDKNLNINQKSTIFQFIDVLIDEAHKYNGAYVKNIEKILPAIIKNICVSSSNMFNVYQSLCSISKHFKINVKEYEDKFYTDLLTEEDKKLIEENGQIESKKFDDHGLILAWKILLERKRRSQFERAKLLRSNPIHETVEEDELFKVKSKDKYALSKRQILSRLEDDRELHKRSKENLWNVNRDKSVLTEQEFKDHYWNKFNALNDEEGKEFFNALSDLNDLVSASYKDQQY